MELTTVPTAADAQALNLLARASAALASSISAAKSELDRVLTDGWRADVYAPRLIRVIEAGAQVDLLLEMVLATDTTPEQRQAARAATVEDTPYFMARRSD